MKTCRSCGHTSPDAARFCDICGETLERTVGASSAASSTEYRVGRAGTCHFQIDLPMVSSDHLAIRQTADGWELRDLHSSNGTWWGAQRQYRLGDDWTRIETREVIWLGSYRLPMSLLTSRLGRGEVATEARQTVRLPADGRMVVGRDPGCDVAIDTPGISRQHLEVVRSGPSWIVRDLGSRNGTFIDGRRIHSEVLDQPTDVYLGSYVLRLDPAGEMRVQPLQGQIRLDVGALGHVIKDRATGKPMRLLHGISFSVYPTEIVAIMGPSGAGKTTLLQALCGYQPATEGHVRLSGADLYQNFARFQGGIGYVPQDDIVHSDLTVGQALEYAVRLRLAEDLSPAEIERRVDGVLEELALSHRKDTRIGSVNEKTLSGGERKRVNLGMELVTDPLILLADEPTSGLSSHDSQEVIAALRRVADKGRPVVVTIHQPSGSLYARFDLALILARGGHVAYFGPTEPQSYAWFGGTPGMPETLLAHLEERPAEAWAERYRSSPIREEWVNRRLTEGDASVAQGPVRTGRGAMPWWPLLTRTFRLKLSSTSQWLRYLAAPLAIMLLLVALFGRVDDQPEIERSTPLFFLVVSALFFGLFNAATEIVSERAIYRRERIAKLGIVAYVLTKFVVLAAITVVQTLVVALPAEVRLGFAAPLSGLVLTLVLIGISAVAAGLVVSTLVPRVETALILIPILVVAELMLSGYFVALTTSKGEHGRAWMAAPMAARWAAEAVLDQERQALSDRAEPEVPEVASTALSPDGAAAQGADAPPLPPGIALQKFMEGQGYGIGKTGRARWALSALTVFFLGLAMVVLRVIDPPILKR